MRNVISKIQLAIKRQRRAFRAEQFQPMVKFDRLNYTGIVATCIFLALLVVGILHAGTVSTFSTVSLRYNVPISGQAAFHARQHAVENSEDTFWPTFWHQNTTTISNNLREATVPAISFSGDASLVWPTAYLAGTAPSAVDSHGVAVSHALAHRLWGSVNIIGKTVYVDNIPRYVRGVFEGDALLALISFHIEDTTPTFTAVELAGGNPTRENVANFAISSGLGRPDDILLGGPISFARVLAIAPIFIPAVYLLVLLCKLPKAKYAIWGVLVLIGFLLPILLNALPPWLIPTRWSDFSFWAGLWADGSYALRTFLSASPTLRDVELKMLLIRQVGIFIAATCVAVWFSCTWSRDKI